MPNGRYSRQELAAVLGVSVHTVTKYVNRKLIPYPERGSTDRNPFYTQDAYDRAVALREHLTAPRTLDQIARELNRPHCVKVAPKWPSP